MIFNHSNERGDGGVGMQRGRQGDESEGRKSEKGRWMGMVVVLGVCGLW